MKKWTKQQIELDLSLYYEHKSHTEKTPCVAYCCNGLSVHKEANGCNCWGITHVESGLKACSNSFDTMKAAKVCAGKMLDMPIDWTASHEVINSLENYREYKAALQKIWRDNK